MKILVGIVYVSTWVLIWGTFGSFIDFPLLQNEVYSAGSIGQITTFSISALISIVFGFLLFKRIIPIRYRD